MAKDHVIYKNQIEEFFLKKDPSCFKNVDCLFCKNPNYYKIISKDYFEVVRCQCGFVFNRLQPDEYTLDDFYFESEAMKSWCKIKSDTKSQLYKYIDAIKFIKSKEYKSVLDVGCGNGAFLELLRSYYPEVGVFGTEFNEHAYDECRKKKIKVIKENIDQFYESNSRSFDVISLWGVLEHLQDPIGSIKKLKTFLNPRGVFIICVPNVESMVVKTIWEKAFTFCPQHLWYFDLNSLSKLYNKCDLDLMQYYTIEPESTPILKYKNGFMPYEDIPKWAEEKYLKKTIIDDYNKSILDQSQGYKIVSYSTHCHYTRKIWFKENL